MPVRNRLQELQKSANITQKDIEAQNMPGSEDGIPMEPLLKNMSEDSRRFFEKIEEIKDNIDTLSNNAESIKKLHAKILTTSAAQKDQTDQNRVDDLVAENKRLGPSISKALKAEAESLKEAGGYKEGQKLGVEMRMKKKILCENTQRFKEEIGNFYNEMDEYKDKQKAQMENQIRIIHPDYQDDEINAIVGSKNIRASNIFNTYTAETEKAKQELNQLEDRHKEMEKLEASIVELMELFKQMAVLVEQQGEMVDNIAKNLGDAAEATEVAAKELGEAVVYKSKAMKKKLLIAAIAATLLLILIITLVSNFTS